MSHSRKINTPIATPFKPAFSRIDGLCNRPNGRPRKMVKPAIAPRAATCRDDMIKEPSLRNRRARLA
jgi:hypothetical protein